MRATIHSKMFDLLAVPAELRIKIYRYVVHNLCNFWNPLTASGQQGLALYCKQLHFEVESEWCKALHRLVSTGTHKTLLQHAPITAFKQGLHIQLFHPYPIRADRLENKPVPRNARTRRALRRLIKSFGTIAIRSNSDSPP